MNEHIIQKSNIDLDDSPLLQHKCQTYMQPFSAGIRLLSRKVQNSSNLNPYLFTSNAIQVLIYIMFIVQNVLRIIST